MRCETKALLLAAALLTGLAPALQAQARTDARRPEVRARPEARGWVGISFRTDQGGAAVVEDVYPNSPARRAGVQEGDTLVQWNGRRDVSAAVGERLAPGDTVRIRIRRGGGRDRDLVLRAEARPRRLVEMSPREGGGREIILSLPDEREIRVFTDSLSVRADSLHRRLQLMLRDSLGPRLRELERDIPEVRIRVGGGQGGAVAHALGLGGRAIAGAELAEMNPDLSSYFGTDRGVLVLRVAPRTPAERAGLQAGDVVVEVDDANVRTVAELRRAVSQQQRRDRREVELKIVRKGKRREVKLRW